MKGTTTGIAVVYLDGVKKATVDLAATAAHLPCERLVHRQPWRAARHQSEDRAQPEQSRQASTSPSTRSTYGGRSGPHREGGDRATVQAEDRLHAPGKTRTYALGSRNPRHPRPWRVAPGQEVDHLHRVQIDGRAANSGMYTRVPSGVSG